jgi:carbamoyl-phosphate synthase/aspartate carbamoyltransferase/dihydroorotase
MEDLIQRMVTRPRQIFKIPEQPETWIEIDPNAEWEICAAQTFTRCGWTPFEGRKVCGRVNRVVLRGVEVFREGQITAPLGFGKNIRRSALTL